MRKLPYLRANRTLLVALAAALTLPLLVPGVTYAADEDDVFLNSTTLELPPPPDMPTGYGVSVLEFADLMRTTAIEALGDRFVEMWVTETQGHLVIGVHDLAEDEKNMLQEEFNAIADVEIVNRLVSRGELDAILEPLMEAIDASGVRWSSISPNYERGIITIGAPHRENLNAIAEMAISVTGEAPLRGEAAREVNKFFNFAAATDHPQVALMLQNEPGPASSKLAAPFTGGKGIGVGPTGKCTAGFAVDGSGGVYGLTAGHCGVTGTTVRMGDTGGQVLGSLQNNTYWNGAYSNMPSDAAVFHLGSMTWNGSVYNTDTTTRTVVAQAGAYTFADPAVPYSWVCGVGAKRINSPEICGYIYTTSTPVNSRVEESSIIRHLVEQIGVYWNSTQWGVIHGDSGGPLYGINPDATAIALGILAQCEQVNDQCTATGMAYYSKIGHATNATGTQLATSGRQPFGWVDGVSGGAGKFTVTGWVIDPDLARTSGTVHVYVGGPAGSGAPSYALSSGVSRPDVQSVYPNTGTNHGFSGTITTSVRGSNVPIYVYGIDMGGTFVGNPLLQGNPVYATIS
jgi:hypothetical protein